MVAADVGGTEISAVGHEIPSVWLRLTVTPELRATGSDPAFGPEGEHLGVLAAAMAASTDPCIFWPFVTYAVAWRATTTLSLREQAPLLHFRLRTSAAAAHRRAARRAHFWTDVHCS